MPGFVTTHYAVSATCQPAICAGIDHLGVLVQGSPAENRAQVADALQQAGDRPILIAPGCAYDPDQLPEANLLAIREACHGGSATKLR
ncbi:MAG TPA: hypothetical protein DCS43_07545 [Verrucomicrobia bacterium]|nr:hypothetical protein [Verrucomicrobiota bacterium]